MAFSNNDFKFLYSGGISNSDPTASLGGEQSTFPIAGTLNNLFPDITEDQAKSGRIDFRCIYVLNSNATDSLTNTTIYISTQIENGSDANIGLLFSNDHQLILVQGSPLNGSVSFEYNEIPLIAEFDSDPTLFARHIQNALNDSGVLAGVICTGGVEDGAVAVHVYFDGVTIANKSHPLLVITSNDIVGSTSIDVSKVQSGSPINSVATLMTSDVVSPPGILFANPDLTIPFHLGTIRAGDSFPLWVRRFTPTGSSGVRYDGFKLAIGGSPD